MTLVPTRPLSLRLQTMPADQGFVPSLNGLRAISILLVFLSHTVSNKVFPGGFGVRVFFLISGFLIARLLFTEWKTRSSISLSNFYIRRLLRLYPVVIVYSAIILFLYTQFKPDRIVWQEPVSALLYFANYYYAHLSQTGQTGGTMPFAIFWSLSVEEHFYVLFPFLFVLLHGNPRKLTFACIAILVFCVSLRLAVANAEPELLATHVFYYETQYQLDSIACGVLLASLCEFKGGQEFLRLLLKPTVIGVALAFLFVGFAVRDAYFRETIRYTLMSASIFILTYNIIFSEKLFRVQLILNTKLMDWIGRLSYSIYVWHYAARSMLSVSSGIWWEDFLLWLSVTLIAASGSYYFIERPVLEFRRRFHDSMLKQSVVR